MKNAEAEKVGLSRLPRGRVAGRALCTVLLLATACVRWQSVPPAGISERPLPRWVQVTTRDSVHYTLEHARVAPGDTLVGRPEDAASVVRLPMADIAHMEARVPSGPGSIGVGLAVIFGVLAMVALIGHA